MAVEDDSDKGLPVHTETPQIFDGLGLQDCGVEGEKGGAKDVSGSSQNTPEIFDVPDLHNWKATRVLSGKKRQNSAHPALTDEIGLPP
jgi:hypothetical protein